MIKDRPARLFEDPNYGKIFPPPYVADWSSTPELIKFSLLTLGGIQPITGAMSSAAGGTLSNVPSPGEIEYFRAQGGSFQLIFVVASPLLAGFDEEGSAIVKPFALTLVPASKRGKVVSQTDIDFVTNVMIGNPLLDRPSSYVGYNPFSGEWAAWGEVGIVIGADPREGFMDELGLVVDHFILATSYDPEDVGTVGLDIPLEAFQRYSRHRTRILFTPFESLRARRVWGVESPIELFLLQELARRGEFPQPQMIVMDDGNVFPSLYDLWNDPGFRGTNGVITEADFFFPESKTAVFCDGRHHLRRKYREKDEVIDAKLSEAGIKTVRLQGGEIVRNLERAGDRVLEAIGR
jgi:hypothetical protein